MTMAKRTEIDPVLAAAFVAAQTELANVGMDSSASTDSGHSYRYSSLGSVMRTVRPVLANHGLAITHDIDSDPSGGLVEVGTVLVHQSGATRRISVALPVSETGNRAQNVGSGITYAKRYGVLSILGLGVEADDDGASAWRASASATEPNQPEREPHPDGLELVTQVTFDRMMAASRGLTPAQKDLMGAWKAQAGIGQMTWAKLTEEDALAIIAEIDRLTSGGDVEVKDLDDEDPEDLPAAKAAAIAALEEAQELASAAREAAEEEFLRRVEDDLGDLAEPLPGDEAE